MFRRTSGRVFSVLVALGIIVFLTASSAIGPNNAYRPIFGDIRGVEYKSVQGGWRVSWKPLEKAVKYKIIVNNTKYKTVRETNIIIPETLHDPKSEDRPAPIIKIQAIGLVQTPRSKTKLGPLGKPTTTLACAPYTFVGVRGSGQNTNEEGWGEGLGDRAWNTIGALRERLGVGYSTIAALGIKYPANRVDTVDGFVTYPQSSQSGRAALKSSLEKWSIECPDTRFILFGYSQGADIIATEWAGWTEELRNRVLSVILFGDPRYNAEDVSSMNQEATWNGPLPSRDPLSDPKVRSWCAVEDVVCQSVPKYFITLKSHVHGSQYDLWQNTEAEFLARVIGNL